MTRPSVLYVSPIDMRANNGMSQLQHQLLATLCSVYGESVDLLSLGAPPITARRWLRDAELRVNVREGLYPLIARMNATLWYGGGVLLCNKVRWIDHFNFPLRTPLPRSWIDRYDMIVGYYPWVHRLLRLDRAGTKVIMDLGDVMADRHARIGVRRWISLTAEEEKAVLRSAGRCAAVSDDDADEFDRLYGVRPHVQSFVPPEHARLVALASAERPPRVGFMGASSYSNEETLRLLSDPLFLDILSGAGLELLVAGGICDTMDRSVLRALENGGAHILGRVPSIVDYYSQISATLNVVGPSTGVKIKSVETLIAGRTLITTRWGAGAALSTAFPDQVAYVDWPIDARTLGELCVEAVRAAKPNNRSAAEAYVDNATRALKEMLSQ